MFGKDLHVTDYARFGVYGLSAVTLWYWYAYLEMVSGAVGLAHLVPNLQGMINCLYYAYIIYPGIVLVGVVASLAICHTHNRFLALLTSLLPIAYLAVLGLFGLHLKNRAMAEGKEIFKQTVVKGVKGIAVGKALF